jgi:tRNA(Ile)-lysidine synthase
MSSSLQSRARDQRYRLFKDLAREIGAERVALGHTADDQAETVLLRMLRGAGLRGLAGMPRVREHMFVRPLLNRTRQDLLRYLESQGQAYRVDSSNAKNLYARNRVRHEVLPGLRRMLPGAVQILARQAQILREDDAVLERLVVDLWPRLLEAETVDRLLFNRRALRDQPLALQRRLLRLAIGRLHPARPTPPFHLVDTILSYLATSRAGATWQWKGLAIRCEQTTLGLCLDRPNRAQGSNAAPRPAPESVVVDCLPWTGCWPATGEMISMRSLSREEGQALLDHGTPDSALLDGERCSMPLTVRAWRTGDWFCPVGMKGRRKKLQDYFTDAKLSRSLRGRVPLIVSAAGIVWVAGYRVDQRFCATRLSARFLHISLKRSQ